MLTKEAFGDDCKKLNDKLSLVNYYRNYGIKNVKLDKAYKKEESYSKEYIAEDYDTFSRSLLPEITCMNFLKDNELWVTTTKQKIIKWAKGMYKVFYIENIDI